MRIKAQSYLHDQQITHEVHCEELRLISIAQNIDIFMSTRIRSWAQHKSAAIYTKLVTYLRVGFQVETFYTGFPGFNIVAFFFECVCRNPKASRFWASCWGFIGVLECSSGEWTPIGFYKLEYFSIAHMDEQTVRTKTTWAFGRFYHFKEWIFLGAYLKWGPQGRYTATWSAQQ